MKSADRGFNVLAMPLVVASLLIIMLAIFGVWSYGKMQDYKNNVTTKVNAAIATAQLQEAAIKDAAFAQQLKYPFRTYTGPSTYGSVVIKYPNTWSAYVIDDTNANPYIDGYFHPVTVPDIQSTNAAFALRVQVIQDSYSSVLSGLQDLVQQGVTKVAPYTAPKVPSTIGIRIDGQLLPSLNKSGSMVIFPLRNMTLELWTEAPQFVNDFNNNVLPNFSFSP